MSANAPQIPGYRIEGLLGTGGMASVWRAKQLSLGRTVAIKVLDEKFVREASELERFLREAKTAARLHHPGIVQVFDVGPSWYAMEYVGGYTFAALLARKKHLAEDDALTIAECVAVAMNYAWSNFQLVHCDIKPDNIMVDADGTVKLADLGLAHSRKLDKSDNGGLAEDDHVIGTPAYMSPEQIYADAPLDCRSDIYSLGATLYHLASGRTLFQGLDNNDMMLAHTGKNQGLGIRTVRPELSLPFARLLRKMLAKDPSLRQQNWKELIEDLERVRSNDDPAGVPPPFGASSMA